MSLPLLFFIHFFVIFIVPLCMILGIGFLLSRDKKKEKWIDVSNHRKDTKFEYIKPTKESTSNWIIMDASPNEDEKGHDYISKEGN